MAHVHHMEIEPTAKNGAFTGRCGGCGDVRTYPVEPKLADSRTSKFGHAPLDAPGADLGERLVQAMAIVADQRRRA